MTGCVARIAWKMPVMMIACIPLFICVHVITEPNSAVSAGFSFFPPATPMLMVTRLSIPPGIPAWQPWVGVVLVLATTAVCVYVAGRIFRVGLLLQGKEKASKRAQTALREKLLRRW